MFVFSTALLFCCCGFSTLLVVPSVSVGLSTCCRSSPLLWLAICFCIGCLICACIPDVSAVCQYVHFTFIVLALMGYSYVLLVMAIVFSHPCLALGGASLCTPLEACYSFATIARRLPSAFILVYLFIPPMQSQVCTWAPIYFTWCVFVCWCVLYVALGRGGSIIYLMPL